MHLTPIETIVSECLLSLEPRCYSANDTITDGSCEGWLETKRFPPFQLRTKSSVISVLRCFSNSVSCVDHVFETDSWDQWAASHIDHFGRELEKQMERYANET